MAPNDYPATPTTAYAGAYAPPMTGILHGPGTPIQERLTLLQERLTLQREANDLFELIEQAHGIMDGLFTSAANTSQGAASLMPLSAALSMTRDSVRRLNERLNQLASAVRQL